MEPINLNDLLIDVDPVQPTSARSNRGAGGRQWSSVVVGGRRICTYLRPPRVVPTSIGIRRSRIYIVLDPGEGERWIPLPPPPPPAAASPSGSAVPHSPWVGCGTPLGEPQVPALLSPVRDNIHFGQTTTPPGSPPVTPWTPLSGDPYTVTPPRTGGAASQAAPVEVMQIDSGGAASQAAPVDVIEIESDWEDASCPDPQPCLPEHWVAPFAEGVPAPLCLGFGWMN